MLLLHAGVGSVEDGNMVADVLKIQDAGLKAIVDVRGQVGNFVGEVDQLRLKRRSLVEKVLVQLRMLLGFVVAGVFDDALSHAKSQVQPGMRGVPLLEALDDAQSVKIVVKVEAVLAHGGIESALPGVAEWRMTDVVDEREGLGKVGIQAKRAGDGTGDRRNLKSVCEAAAEVVGIAVRKNLRLARHAPKRSGMSYASAIAFEGAAIGVHVFRIGPGSERIIVVDAAHRADGKIHQLQVGIGCAVLAHYSSLLRSSRHPGLDISMRLVYRDEDFVWIVLSKGRKIDQQAVFIRHCEGYVRYGRHFRERGLGHREEGMLHRETLVVRECCKQGLAYFTANLTEGWIVRDISPARRDIGAKEPVVGLAQSSQTVFDITLKCR